MITIDFTPIEHQLLLDSLFIAKRQMLKHGLVGSAEMITDLQKKISFDETQESSKTHESKKCFI